MILPETAKPAANEAVVLAVGPGALNHAGTVIPPAVKAGDRVLLPEFGGTKIEMGKEELYLFRDSDILAIVEQA